MGAELVGNAVGKVVGMVVGIVVGMVVGIVVGTAVVGAELVAGPALVAGAAVAPGIVLGVVGPEVCAVGTSAFVAAGACVALDATGGVWGSTGPSADTVALGWQPTGSASMAATHIPERFESARIRALGWRLIFLMTLPPNTRNLSKDAPLKRVGTGPTIAKH